MDPTTARALASQLMRDLDWLAATEGPVDEDWPIQPTAGSVIAQEVEAKR